MISDIISVFSALKAEEITLDEAEQRIKVIVIDFGVDEYQRGRSDGYADGLYDGGA